MFHSVVSRIGIFQTWSPCETMLFKRLDPDLRSETLEELALEVGSIDMWKYDQAHSWH